MHRIRLITLGLLLLSGLGATHAEARSLAQGTTCQAFAQTGHQACGVFLAYWQGHGGLAQQGYPISDEFQEINPLDGKAYRVQYFQRAVFEYHPENQPPYDVLLSQLGAYRLKQKYGANAPAGQPAAGGTYFAQTKHTVGGAFLAYWQQHGGLAQQGYPISDEFTELSDTNGQPYRVQYFERAVFEMHPENQAPYNVLLTLLGTWRSGQLYANGFPGGFAAGAPPTQPPAATAPPKPAAGSFQKGMNYTAWYAGTLNTPGADQALRNLAATGANSLALVVTQFSDAPGGTHIGPTPSTPTDDDVRHTVALAHSLGLRVMLKPHVDLTSGAWRGTIAYGNEGQWQAWFASYREFIGHYADLGQATGADLLAVGTELMGTTAREADWRAVVATVRGRYHGPITYASNMSEERAIHWWDALDLIGVDAYYELADGPGQSVEQLTAAWVNRGYVGMLQSLSQQYNRPILLTEIGYRSVAACAAKPWDWTNNAGSPDPQAQATAYRAAFNAFWGKPWLAGMYWWNWEADPNRASPPATSFSPVNKPALAVLSEYYR
jgi:hypothetical protein